MSRWWMHDAFMLTLLRGFYYGDLNVFVLLCNTWQKTAILGLWVWDGVVCVCVCHAKLEIFLRFSSRAPGKCLITSGFVLSAMIILFYAVLFSYSGLGMKALIFHWSTHWGTFCVYIWVHSYFFYLLVPIGTRFNICATAFSILQQHFQYRSVRQEVSRGLGVQPPCTNWTNTKINRF